MTPVWRVKIIKSSIDRIHIDDTVYDDYHRYLDGLQGKEDIILVIRRRPKYRTNQQNAYFWSVVCPLIAREFGWDVDDAYYWIEAEFLREPDGRIGKIKKLTTVQFNELKEKVQRFFAAEGLQIPDPNESMSESEIMEAMENQWIAKF